VVRAKNNVKDLYFKVSDFHFEEGISITDAIIKLKANGLPFQHCSN